VHHGRLKTVLVASGPETSSQKQLVQAWSASQKGSRSVVFIQLQPGQAANLQSALKNIIKACIIQHDGIDAYTNFLAGHKALIPMNFDLELLQQYVEKQGITRLVLSILDVETFDPGFLAELISALSSWTDRIPFVLLLGVATTVELLDARLPKSIIPLLDAKVFELARPKEDQLYNILEVVQHDPEAKLLLGTPSLTTLFELTQDQSTTVDGFTRAIKFICMSHFFANPLAVFLSPSELMSGPDTTALCEAIRNTCSFREHCELLLQGSKTQRQTVRDLLTNDSILLEGAQTAVKKGQQDFRAMLAAIRTMRTLYTLLSLPHIPAFEFELQLMLALPSLTETDTYDEITDALQKLSPGRLLTLLSQPSLQSLADYSPVDVPALREMVASLHHLHDAAATTAQTWSHSTSASTSTMQDYTTILTNVISFLHSYLTTTTSPPPNIPAVSSSFPPFLHESFLHHAHKIPLLSTLHPRSRHAIERALSKPSDYLGCECCGRTRSDFTLDNTNTQSTNPNSTSVLHTVLTEAPATVNVADLFAAFCSRIHSHSQSSRHPTSKREGEEEDEEDDPDPAAFSDCDSNSRSNEYRRQQDQQRHDLALFHRSLSDLKLLGLVKPCKKKPVGASAAAADYIMKTTWTGM